MGEMRSLPNPQNSLRRVRASLTSRGLQTMPEGQTEGVCSGPHLIPRFGHPCTTNMNLKPFRSQQQHRCPSSCTAYLSPHIPVALFSIAILTLPAHDIHQWTRYKRTNETSKWEDKMCESQQKVKKYILIKTVCVFQSALVQRLCSFQELGEKHIMTVIRHFHSSNSRFARHTLLVGSSNQFWLLRVSLCDTPFCVIHTSHFVDVKWPFIT